MTIAQRRNIWREIDANYRDDGAGYIGTVTDHSIAEKLKVPRAWVSNIREQDFGPEGSNEALQEIGRELSKIAKLVVEVTDDAMNAAARAETLSGTIKDVERRLREVERAVGPHRNFTNRGING
jgi:predicted transcriptional regulator